PGCNCWRPSPLRVGPHRFTGCQAIFGPRWLLFTPFPSPPVVGGFHMKRTRWLGIPLLSTLMLIVSVFPTQALAPTTYYIADTMHLTPAMNQLKSFDISFVDPRTETYVFTDRNNKGLDVFDGETNRFLRNI